MTSTSWRVLALALVCALVGASGAMGTSSLIVPGRSIGPVLIGEEAAVLYTAHGLPKVTARVRNPVAPTNRNLDRVSVYWPALRIFARFNTDEASSNATRLATASPRYRTALGIGVGSTRAAVRSAYRAAVCVRSQCRLGQPSAGAVVTRFQLARGRVTRVQLVTLP